MQPMEDFLRNASDSLRTSEPLSRHTTFQIGGFADFAAWPASVQEWQAIWQAARALGIPCCVIGRGSNVLFDDEGYRGLVLFSDRMSEISRTQKGFSVGCGVALFDLANAAARASLDGLSWAQGIPGSVGGAVFMNAGAYGGCMADVVLSVTCIRTDNGKIETLRADECGFGERHSIFMENGWVILSSEMSLPAGNEQDIRARMAEYRKKRAASQPLEWPSAGSVFKRPDGYFAGKLIEDAGLKGYTVGGAEVSQKHAGFIINRGGASSRDVTELIFQIQNTVLERFGVRLEPEIRYISPNGETV